MNRRNFLGSLLAGAVVGFLRAVPLTRQLPEINLRQVPPLTLLEACRRLDPQGHLDAIVAILGASNELLAELPYRTAPEITARDPHPW